MGQRWLCVLFCFFHWGMESDFIPLEFNLALVTWLINTCSECHMQKWHPRTSKVKSEDTLYLPSRTLRNIFSVNPKLLRKIQDYSETTIFQRPRGGATVNCLASNHSHQASRNVVKLAWALWSSPVISWMPSTVASVNDCGQEEWLRNILLEFLIPQIILSDKNGCCHKRWPEEYPVSF